jgi:hypothetical protein
MKVFIGGSRKLSRLNPATAARLDRLMEAGLSVLIGDAIGADKAVQSYLWSQGYKLVEVFCTGPSCRNNVGNWPVRHVASGTHAKGRAFYMEKDKIMAREASVGLMLWDGQSPGTLLNVWRLIRAGKCAVIYVSPRRKFMELRDEDGWRKLLGSLDASVQDPVAREVRKETEDSVADSAPGLPASAPGSQLSLL